MKECINREYEVNGLQLRVCVNECVYEPSDDTMLIAELIIRHKDTILNDVDPRVVVEVGSGTGILSLLAYKIFKPDKMISIDINPYSIYTSSNTLRGIDSIQVIRCDGLSCIIGDIDLLIINPPYLPVNDYSMSDECLNWLSKSWGDSDMLYRLCMEYSRLSKSIITVYSSLSPVDLAKCLEDRGHNVKASVSKGFFMEEITAIYTVRV